MEDKGAGEGAYYRAARRLTGTLLLIVDGLVVLAATVVPGLHVDPFGCAVLAVAGAALLGVDVDIPVPWKRN